MLKVRILRNKYERKILIVDYEELITRTLSKLLQKKGYEAYIGNNSEEALVIIEEENMDLIISDIRMPNIDGISLNKADTSL
jgi:CheY-like chemotaxis protein